MDRIEVSNLNRQFLFRSVNVGQPKSVTAAAAARVMNPELKVRPCSVAARARPHALHWAAGGGRRAWLRACHHHILKCSPPPPPPPPLPSHPPPLPLQVAALETPVGEDTEATFDDTFWESLDCVVNALDNLKARQYVDSRCVFYGLPLLESGTLGTKANCQVIVPHATESYSDSVDPPEESIPMCTLRNFPHAIEHCIEWARDVFAGSFANAAQDASAFVADPAGWLASVAEEGNLSARRGKLEGVAGVLHAAQGADYALCVRLAREAFNGHFYMQIRQLLHNFPLDYTGACVCVDVCVRVLRVCAACVLLRWCAAMCSSRVAVPPSAGAEPLLHASRPLGSPRCLRRHQRRPLLVRPQAAAYGRRV